MNPAKSAMLAGALTILAGTLAFEWATFSQSAIADKIPAATLIAGLVGLIIWLAGCVMMCRKASAATLFGSGAAMLVFLFVGGAMLERLWPSVTNAPGRMGGLLAPMAASFIGGMMLILVGIFRLGSK
jgi:hypothetical protein